MFFRRGFFFAGVICFFFGPCWLRKRTCPKRALSSFYPWGSTCKSLFYLTSKLTPVHQANGHGIPNSRASRSHGQHRRAGRQISDAGVRGRRGEDGEVKERRHPGPEALQRALIGTGMAGHRAVVVVVICEWAVCLEGRWSRERTRKAIEWMA